jgi:hypothetical protein
MNPSAETGCGGASHCLRRLMETIRPILHRRIRRRRQGRQGARSRLHRYYCWKGWPRPSDAAG